MAGQMVKKFVNLIEFTVLFFFVGLSVYGVVYTYDSIMGKQIKPLYTTKDRGHISVKQVKASSLQNIKVYEIKHDNDKETDSSKNNQLTISNLENQL